jgi:hypothetical protein
MAKRRRSYFWAREVNACKSPNYNRLSDPAEEGLELAQTLARYAEFRAAEALGTQGVPPPLTFAELAEQKGRSATTVRRQIEQARHELWGPIGDRAVYYQLKRYDELAERVQHLCQAPGCDQLLPRQATVRRKYCNGTCRVRAHRAQPGAAAWPPQV